MKTKRFYKSLKEIELIFKRVNQMDPLKDTSLREKDRDREEEKRKNNSNCSGI